MSERPQLYAKICSTLQTGYVALLGQRDADLPAVISSIVNSNALVPGMKFVSVALPQGIHDGDEFRALVLERLLQSATWIPPETTLSNELEQVLALHQTRTLKFRLQMALETLGKRTSAAYLVIVLQALPVVPQEPLKNLLLMLRDYHNQLQAPGTAGAKIRFLAMGNEALWRLCYHEATGASPFNIAERIWLGGLAYQEVQGLCKKRKRLENAVRLKCLTDGIPNLVRLAIKQDTASRDLSLFFGELQDYWNSLSVDSRESLKRVAQGSEIFPSCLLDSRCPQIPDLKSPWTEAFWGGFLRVRHRELAWRSPIHRAFVMQRARMKQADSPSTQLKQELPDRSARLRNALNIIHRYEDSEECMDEALILAVLSEAVELAELLDMVRQQEPFGTVLERLRASASETNSPSLQKLSERIAKQKHAMNRLLVEASLQAVQQHLFQPQRETLPLTKSRERGPVKQPAKPQPLATPPHVFVSYAWGDISPNASEEDRQRQEVVERLCRAVDKENWKVIRDKEELDYGDQISSFMKALGKAGLVIVVLSDKYLHSPYCMTELHTLYKNARQERQEFLDHIVPLALADARIGTWRDRAAYAKHWETEFKAMEQDFTHLGEEDLKLYKAMKRWHNEVGNMLAYVNDVLVPRGFEDIVKDDFASLRQMLWRRR